MITLQDILDDLEAGELNQFTFNKKMLEDEDDGFDPTDWPTIIRQINLGLTALHTRFTLRERIVTINTEHGTSVYPLESKYSIHETGQHLHYIQDTVDDRFSDDIIQIRDASDEYGSDIPMNQHGNPDSLLLKNYKTVQFLNAADNYTIHIHYQANHPKIDVNTADPTTVEVFIPEYLREPLYLYVTSRLLSRSVGQETKAVANSLMLQYNQLCDNIERLNSINTSDNAQHTKLEANGWL